MAVNAKSGDIFGYYLDLKALNLEITTQKRKERTKPYSRLTLLSICSVHFFSWN
jgi:hypothetical protein